MISAHARNWGDGTFASPPLFQQGQNGMRTLIASNEVPSAEILRREMQRQGYEDSSCQIVPFDRVVSQISQFKPDLIALVLPPATVQGQSLLAELRRLLAIPILVFGPANNPKFILQILREGGSEYLDEADCRGEFQGALERMQSQQTKREATGKIITVMSSCGGGGASTLAANLATALALDCKKSLLVDLVLKTGNQAALFDLRPTYSLSDLCNVNGLIDRSMVERALSRHESGVHLLASPRRQDTFITLLNKTDPRVLAVNTADSLRQTLALSRFMFPYIVIDHSPTFSEEQLQALRMADSMLLVLRLEFAALRNVQRLLEHMDHLGLPRDKVRLIANRLGQPKEVPAEKAAEALKMPIFHLIPDDPTTINRASNFGIPALLDAPRSKIANSFRELAKKIREIN
jgi:pilus assembly protein CpaE